MKNNPLKMQSAPATKENREQKGVRLAEARMPKLRKRLKSIGHLGNYSLGENRIEKLCATLDEWVNETKVLLRNHKKEDEETYRL